MDSLEKKLNDLKDQLIKAMKQGGLGGAGSVKAGAVLPSINKLPKVGNNSATPSVGKAPTSKKNPLKAAEQIQNKDIKDIKMKEAQSALKGPEMIKFEKNGQWSLDKSGYKGYNAADNERRKKNNLTTETDIKSMPRVKQYGGSGASAASKQAARDKAKSKKNPVKIMTGNADNSTG